MPSDQEFPVSSPSAGDRGSNTPFLTVSELAGRLKATVENAFDFVRVRAEISRPTRATSGHVYFTLKDDRSTLDAVCWKTVAGHLSVQPEEGLEVIVTGKLTIYGGRAKYQIVVQQMEVAGEGAMEVRFRAGSNGVERSVTYHPAHPDRLLAVIRGFEEQCAQLQGRGPRRFALGTGGVR